MPATKQLSAFCVVLFSLLGVCRALLGTPETVFVAHSNNLINFTVNGNHLRYRTWASPVTEQRQFGEVRGLDCEKRKELLCWVDKKVNAIRCSSTQPKAGCSDDSPTTFLAVNIVSNNGKPEGVALDPCNMMLYWTDPSRSTISVAKLQRDDKGDIRAVMTKDILTAKNGLSKPFGIAVDSCAG
ncbi:protein cueball-like [Corticium candelabrum]|uniref:protein cueball-like n=1 Tax=Corticium candelabrum TaxID=121492 RepID=UPI002E25B8D4|nr:protein cueball-like [Corticium candelabrum]